MLEIMEMKVRDLKEAHALIRGEFPYARLTLGMLRGKLASPNIFMFKAVERGKFIGFIEFELDKGIGTINGLGVKGEFRNKDAGTRLVEFAIGFMKEHGAAEIMLDVRERNAAAKKVYSKFGFRRAGVGKAQASKEKIEKMSLAVPQKAPRYVS